MSGDIEKRLRALQTEPRAPESTLYALADSAADEIERLRAACDREFASVQTLDNECLRLRAALERIANANDAHGDVDYPGIARTALANTNAPPPADCPQPRLCAERGCEGLCTAATGTERPKPGVKFDLRCDECGEPVHPQWPQAHQCATPPASESRECVCAARFMEPYKSHSAACPAYQQTGWRK